MIEYQDAKQIATMLAAVGEPTRLQILHWLAREPHHVGRLAGLIGTPMVNISHHLGVLRQAGLIEDAKEGRRVVYAMRPGVFAPGGDSGIVGTLTAGEFKLVLLDTPGPQPGGVRRRDKK
jgi:DNA-binding transcriptional ArsR family regulator